jgi:hypothetical protein
VLEEAGYLLAQEAEALPKANRPLSLPAAIEAATPEIRVSFIWLRLVLLILENLTLSIPAGLEFHQ